jgi:NADPH-dependent ferric siderophore reductase
MGRFESPDTLPTIIPGTRRFVLEVIDAKAVTPHMRRIRLGNPELQEFTYLPGQDIMLWVSADGERMVYRRYTIRSFDSAAGHLDLDIVVHEGEGPGMRWAATAKPGNQVETVGPRGKITVVPAAWQLFMGDESFIPAAFSMLEALPTGTPAWAFLEVKGPEEEQTLSVDADLHLTWVHRGSAPAGDPKALVAAVEAAVLPDEAGHAYIGAELRVAAAVRQSLEQRGMAVGDISSKAYWGRGRANASHGEPNREE